MTDCITYDSGSRTGEKAKQSVRCDLSNPSFQLSIGGSSSQAICSDDIRIG